MSDLDRRAFLAASTPAFLLPHHRPQEQPKPPTEPNEPDRPFLESQRMPEPKIVLPTDGVAKEGRPLKIAAITTAYWKYSHADDIITKFIEGYAVLGRIHNPHCRVVSLYVEQFPKSDIGRGMADRYRIPMFDKPRETLTLGGKKLAVDGVLLIGEHGDYPLNKLGQKLYPRHRLFSEIVKVFQATGKSVPVYNDKHFSYSWEKASWMYEQSKKLGFAMMAGSSVPVAWRRPALEVRPGTELKTALSVGAGHVESSGFHVLETLQAFVERRKGGESGVRSVQCLQGSDAVWGAAKKGLWSRQLLEDVLEKVPHREGKIEEVDREPTVFLVNYSDGFRAGCYVSNRYVREYSVGVQDRNGKRAATWCYLPKPQRDHFSFLCNHVEKMFLTGKSSYPVERTLLVTGALEALMQSIAQQGKEITTTHLSKMAYEPT